MKMLLAIDVQPQFSDGKGNYEKCVSYVNKHAKDYDSVIATYFKQNEKNPNYIKHLNWDGCCDTMKSQLEFVDETINYISKNGYGDASDDKVLLSAIPNRTVQIDIIGCDADACVMAVCFQLWDAGFTNMRILTDYIYTTAKDISLDSIVAIMKRNFGDCVVSK